MALSPQGMVGKEARETPIFTNLSESPTIQFMLRKNSFALWLLFSFCVGCQTAPERLTVLNQPATPIVTTTTTADLSTPTHPPLTSTAPATIPLDPTPTTLPTLAPIPEDQPAELSAGAVWWYFSNPGGGGAFHTIGQGADGLVMVGSDLSGAYLNRSISDPASRWEVIGLDRGLSQTHVSATGFHPTEPEILFLGTDGGIFRSADGGDTFQQVYPSGYIHDFAFGADRNVVYATYHPEWDSDQGEVLKSIDGGFEVGLW